MKELDDIVDIMDSIQDGAKYNGLKLGKVEFKKEIGRSWF